MTKKILFLSVLPIFFLVGCTNPVSQEKQADSNQSNNTAEINQNVETTPMADSLPSEMNVETDTVTDSYTATQIDEKEEIDTINETNTKGVVNEN